MNLWCPFYQVLAMSRIPWPQGGMASQKLMDTQQLENGADGRGELAIREGKVVGNMVKDL